jgi:hypothetical protein
VTRLARGARAQANADEEELLDYEEEEEHQQTDASSKKAGGSAIHATGFRDFLLRPELLRAIVDCGFEHPSEGTPFPLLPPRPTQLLCRSLTVVTNPAGNTAAFPFMQPSTAIGLRRRFAFVPLPRRRSLSEQALVKSLQMDLLVAVG